MKKFKKTFITLFWFVLVMVICIATMTACKENGNQVAYNDNKNAGNNIECNHSYGAWTTTQSASCTEKGNKHKVCSLCGDIVTEEIEALGHIEVIDRAISPTCTETGLTEGKHCGRCEMVFIRQQTVDSLGHNYVDGECSRCHSIDPDYQAIDPEEEARLQRIALENSIEISLKNKLNEIFEEEYVENVDVKYFSLEQDSQLNTTVIANGTIKFTDEDDTHTVSLALPLDGDDFATVSPIYYIDADEDKDLAQNYDVENLTAINNFLSNQELQFSSAKLDGKNWNYNSLTPAQIEKQLEDYYEIRSVADLGEEYLKNVDFKYISTEFNSSYGYMVVLNGVTGNVYNSIIKDLCVKIIISKSDYDFLNSKVLTTEIDQEKDLKDNYNVEQLNQVIDIINNGSSYLKCYEVGGFRYSVTSRTFGV